MAQHNLQCAVEGGMNMSLFGNASLVNTQAVSLDHVQKLSINYISEGITIHETEGEALILKEYFNDDDPDYYADITVTGEDVVIRHGYRPIPNLLRGYVEVYLPRSYFGVLNVKTVSGRVEAGGRLVLEELAASSTSGRIGLGDVTAGRAVLSTVSGSIGAGRLRALADVHSTSGSVQITSAEGAGVFKTVSGGIEAGFTMVTGNIVAGSTSGRVRLSLPADLSYALEAKSVSGRLQTPIIPTANRHSVSGTVGNEARVQIRVSTVSGSIEVSSKR